MSNQFRSEHLPDGKERSTSEAEKRTKFEKDLFGWKGFCGAVLFSIPFGIVMMLIFKAADALGYASKSSLGTSWSFALPFHFWLVGKMTRLKKEVVYDDVPSELAEAIGKRGLLRLVRHDSDYPLPLLTGTLVKVPNRLIQDLPAKSVVWMVEFIARRQEAENKSLGLIGFIFLMCLFGVGGALQFGRYGFLAGVLVVIFGIWIGDHLLWSRTLRKELEVLSSEDFEPAKQALRYAIQKQSEQPIYNKWLYSSLKYKKFLQILEAKKSTT